MTKRAMQETTFLILTALAEGPQHGYGIIQDVAARVGYESEAAFNRAFKRATGSPPAAWRRGALNA